MFKFVTLLIFAFFTHVHITIETHNTGVFALMRHGARAPFTPVTAYYKSIGAKEPYDLTVFGSMEHETLGRFFMKRYRDYSMEDVVVYANDIERCIKSMIAFGKGYFSNGEKGQMLIIDNSFFAPVNYSKFNAHQLRVVEKEGLYLNRLYNTAVKYGLTDVVKNHCSVCEKPKSLAEKLKLMKEMFSLYYCNLMNHAPITHFTQELVPLLTTAELSCYAIENIKYQYAVSSSYHIFKLLRRFLLKIDNKVDNKPKSDSSFKALNVNKGTFLFGHDHNIMAVLVVLLGAKTVFHNVEILPEFAASVVFETFKVRNGDRLLLQLNGYVESKTYVRFMYRFKEITLHFCKAQNCTVDEFVAFIDKLHIK